MDRVVRMQTRRQGILTTKRRNAIWCQPESAMFCTHLSHFGYAVTGSCRIVRLTELRFG